MLAGINGAGKSSFYSRHLAALGLPFVNADLIAREREGRWATTAEAAYAAAGEAETRRRALMAERQSFCMETVFSHPSKLDLLRDATAAGYRVTLIFIGLEGPELALARVFHRGGHGGHEVPVEKILARYPRVMASLGAAIPLVAQVRLYDNSAAGRDYRLVAVFEGGQLVQELAPVPNWASPFLSAARSPAARANPEGG